MASRTDSTSWSDWAHSVEPWILPAIAAVVVAGALLLCTLIGMFWLAAQPVRQPIVILIRPAIEREQPVAGTASILEKGPDARAN